MPVLKQEEVALEKNKLLNIRKKVISSGRKIMIMDRGGLPPKVYSPLRRGYLVNMCGAQRKEICIRKQKENSGLIIKYQLLGKDRSKKEKIKSQKIVRDLSFFPIHATQLD